MHIEGQFSSVGMELGMGKVSAVFYPYAELKHTWSSVDGFVKFRISDYLERAPDAVIESLAWYLISRANRRRCSPEKSRPYLEYARSQDLWTSIRSAYLERSRSLDLDPVGEKRDLSRAYEYVSSYYFANKTSQLQLAWAHESPRRRLGYYMEPLRLLAVNKILDSAEIPRYVLEFVIFHEMLHHFDALDGSPLKRVRHTRQFRAQEKRFSHYDEAEAWLKKIVSRSARRC